MTGKIKKYQNDFIKFLRSTDFSKAIVLTIAIVFPIGIFSNLGNLEIGISLAMGCLLSSPSDVPGSFKHKVYGILAAALLGAISFCIAGYAAKFLWAIIPMLAIMMFAISYLSVYGFRASLVTFSGLLAVVLSFANISSGIEIWQKSLLIGIGGIWYLLVSISWYLIKPERATEQLIAETMELTAGYLRLRVELFKPDSNEKEIQKKLFQSQSELNEHHESLREILISSRQSSGSSGYARKRLLIFIDLVDMLELAMANPIDFKKMQGSQQENSLELKVFANFSLKMATQLEAIALAMLKNSELPENKVPDALGKVEEALRKFRSQIDIGQRREEMLMLRNLFDYQSKQAQKINNIDRILRNLEGKRKLFVKDKEFTKFLTQQEYSFKTLTTNFNFDSAIFRHSLRLSLVVLAGYLIGDYFSVQNSYWILLTVVVIMRPNYGLTKQRTRKRIVGTLIGGVIAVGIVFLTQNTTVYAVLGILSLTLAFSLIQRNYTTAAIFITLSIIFIYALLQPEVLNVIQFRIVDTLIGAGLAAFGNLLLWPKWESQNLNNVIATSLKSNLEYLEEIDRYYHEKKSLPISYKLSRKKAFLDMGALSGAFQRMTQEPKSRQKQVGLIYEIVGLNQTFLSAVASMGTYIRTHPTTRASEDFETYTKAISVNLKNCVNILENKEMIEKENLEISLAGKSLQQKFDKLAEQRDLEIEAGKEKIDEQMRFKLQEAHLVTGQLEWLLDISEKLQVNIEKLNKE
ncbi:putative membrane protein (TIGR01666 family) [Christiangramia gaetbulicola]|uniref:Putative membrane protein (TIGR01666 family) n=1 Tax=Christiangramia gaetbulicola TaxID=703340 RepID=A0A2T6AHA6_9FLAO|nr:FUSC family membrane protein [Christiangramia gaetbulicola]PTX43167.1 putative membrane protein (TIGR01666 family) [Christiangramia gaetbulicola]